MAASWRSACSPQVQWDLDHLLEMAVGDAQKRLVECGGFHPFAAAVGVDGAVGVIAFPEEVSDGGEAAEIMDGCVAALRGVRSKIRAGAVTADVTGEYSDAIRVDLEHRDGPAFTAFVPYRQAADHSGIIFEPVRAKQATHRFYTTDD